MSFSDDTAIAHVGPGSFTAELHERWSSLVGIHGGYTASIVANAMTAAVDDPSRALRSFATQFASVPGSGPVDIEVSVERTGKSMTTTSARLLQEGRVLQVARGELDDSARPRLRRPRPPRGADPGDGTVRVLRRRWALPEPDVRLDPDVVPFGGGTEAWVAASGYARWRAKRSTRPGWSRCVTCSRPRGLQSDDRPGQGGDDRVRRAPGHR